MSATFASDIMSNERGIPNGTNQRSRAVVRQLRKVYSVLLPLDVHTFGSTCRLSSEAPSPAAEMNDAAQRGDALYRQFNCMAYSQINSLGGHSGLHFPNVRIAEANTSDFAMAMVLPDNDRMPDLP